MKLNKLFLITILALLAIFTLAAEGKKKKHKKSKKVKWSKLSHKHCARHDEISIIVRGDKEGRFTKSMIRNVNRAIKKGFTDFAVAVNGKDVARGTKHRSRNVKFLRFVAQNNTIVLLPWDLGKIDAHKPKTAVKQYHKSSNAVRKVLSGKVLVALLHKDHNKKKVVRALAKKKYIVIKKTFENLKNAFHSKKDNFIVTIEARSNMISQARKSAKRYMYDIKPLRECLRRGRLIEEVSPQSSTTSSSSS